MASKRAVPRTESVNRQSKGSSNRHQRPSGQGGPSVKLTQDSDHPSRSTSRRNTTPAHSTEFKSSDPSIEIAQIGVQRSFDRASSAASTTNLIDFAPLSKRRRLHNNTVDYSHSHQNPGRGTRTENVTGSAHQRHPSIEETGSISTRREFANSTGSSNRRKTGPCNSKRLRGRGHVGGSSSDHIFITDLNQSTDDGHYSPTGHSSLAVMPANLEDQNHPSTSASKVSTRGSRSQETSEPSSSGAGVTSNWLRSFTCFTNNADDEQIALDLSASSNRSGDTHSRVGTNQPNISEDMVFTNPVQSEFAGSAGVGGNLVRLVTSLSSSAVTPPFTNTISTSSSSRTLRHQRGGTGASSARHDSSSTSGRRLAQGSSRQSSSRASQPPNAPSPSVHIHQHQSTSDQSQSHHHQIQGSGINYRILQLKNLRNDISAQMLLLQEINQALLMGSDDSLAGLAVQELVSAVVDLLSAEEALACLPEEEVIEIKNLSCNILAHLMDVIPKAADAVVMAVPLLINTMSCSFVGDILERIINVLEQVSRRNGRQVLLYGGVASVMSYYDFVTVAQHRTILSMVANCFANVRKEDFDSHIAGCLFSLCDRLSPMASTEPRCLERVCLCFARLIHAFKSEPERLRHIASFGLCEHLRHLLAASPPIVSNMKDISNMLATLCNYCPDLAVDILKMGYAETVYNLLTDQKPQELSLHSPTAKSGGAARGPRSTSLRTSIARTLEIRGPENVSAIINLIKAMLPPVQEGNIAVCPPTNSAAKTSRASSSSYNARDMRIALFREQCKTFENMVTHSKPKAGDEKTLQGGSVENLVIVKAVHLLFPMLLDLYTELNGITPRLKCIEAIERIVCNISPFVLSWVVSPRAVSSIVADMLGNPEFSLIAAGLRLASMFIARIPNVFAVYFRKEGVLFRLHQLSSLADDEGQGEEPAREKTSGLSTSVVLVDTPPTSSTESMPYHLRSSNYSEPMITAPGTSRTSIRFRRISTNQRAPVEETVPKSPHFIDPGDLEGSASDSYGSSDSSSSATLDMDTTGDFNQTLANQSAAEVSVDDNGYRDSNLRSWIKSQCQELYDRIQTFVTNQPKPETLASKAAAGKKSTRRNPSASHHFLQLVPVPRDLVPELEALSLQLRKADDPATWVDGLTHLANLLIQQMSASEDEAPSPFEIQQSGMLNALQAFLSDPTERRLRFFLLLRVFVGPRYTENIDLKRIVDSPKLLAQTKSALLSLKQKPDVHELAFPMLVNCLLDCLHQQEHFQVLTNPASLSSTDAYAEEMLMDLLHRRQSGPTPPPPQPTEVPTRRSGATSSRRSANTSGDSESDFLNDPQSSISPPPRQIFSRRMAGLAPGYLKLELIRQMDEPSSSDAGSSSQGVSGASAVGATSSKKSPSEPSIYDQAPASISLQISSLLTPLRLRNQLAQRCMIASVMHFPDSGDRFIPRDFVLDREEGLMASIANPTLTQQFLQRRRGGRRTIQALESMHTRSTDDPSAPVESRTQPRSVPSSSSTFTHSRDEFISMEREILSSRAREYAILEEHILAAEDIESPRQLRGSTGQLALSQRAHIHARQQHFVVRPMHQQQGGYQQVQPQSYMTHQGQQWSGYQQVYSHSLEGDPQLVQSQEQQSRTQQYRPGESGQFAQQQGYEPERLYPEQDAQYYVLPHVKNEIQYRRLDDYYQYVQAQQEEFLVQFQQAQQYQQQCAYQQGGSGHVHLVPSTPFELSQSTNYSAVMPYQMGGFSPMNVFPAQNQQSQGYQYVLLPQGVSVVPLPVQSQDYVYQQLPPGVPRRFFPVNHNFVPVNQGQFVAPPSVQYQQPQGQGQQQIPGLHVGVDSAMTYFVALPIYPDPAEIQLGPEANPRSRNLSLLAAFGMLQFPGSTSGIIGSGNPPSSSSMAATQALPASSSQLGTFQMTPDMSVSPRSTTNPQHSHSRSTTDATALGSNSAGANAAAPPNAGGSSRRERGHHGSAYSHASSASVAGGSSSHPHHSTRLLTQQQQQQQSGHRYPMILSGSSADFLESAAGASSLVPVFYIGGHRIPDRMPLYQALRVFSPEVKERSRQLLAEHRFSMTEQNREDRINAFIWRNVHPIHYVLEKASTTPNTGGIPLTEFQFLHTSASPTASTSAATVKHSPTSSISAAISCLKRSRRSEESTATSTPTSAFKPAADRLFTFLEPLTDCDALNEGYMAVNLGLLRILYGLSEFGNTLDDLVQPFPIVPADHFQSQKLSAKASRQLQDVFYVLAGNFPNWLVQTISTCPFLFPFSVRQNFFYVHNFDRERTILHLQDTITNGWTEDETTGGNGSHGGVSRRERGGRSSIVQRLSQFGRHSLTTVRYGGFDGGTAILENLLSESSPQIQRHKITVSRDPKRLLRSAETAMNDLRDSRSIVEIAFEGEVGFGLGPTLEFYTLVSHQLMASSLNLWHGDNFTADGYIIAPAPGLYPRPLPKNLRSGQSKDIRAKFYFLGQLMARALLDWRQLDLSLSPTLLKWFLYVQSPEEDLVLSGPRVGVTPADLALVDPPFAKHFHSLLKLARRRKELADELASVKTAIAAANEELRAIDSEVDDLCLTFVLPGYQIDLCRNGSQTSVTGNNLGEYLNLVANWFLVEGVRRQVTALILGFDSVLPGVRTGKLATLFRPDECEGLFCGSGSLGGLYRDQLSLLRTGVASQAVSMVPMFLSSKNTGASTSAAAAGWDVDTLMKSCLCDHGYTHQSTAIQYLFEIMSEFDETQRRLFIQFATGSPRLPIGGFRALKPPLKIVMKREAEEHADQHLPSVMTCQNYLKLPNYSSKKIMLEKLLYAIHEGQHAFHLS